MNFRPFTIIGGNANVSTRLCLQKSATGCVVTALAFLLVMNSLGMSVQAQMIRSSLPFTRVNNSWYERLGIDFGFHLRGSGGNPLADNARGVYGYGPGGQILPNITFSQGSVNSAIPPFGQYDPGADATFGYNVRNGSGGYHLGFRFGKGSNRSITNTTPVLMTRNGATGSLFNGTANPFVTGIVPVVGKGANAIPDMRTANWVSPLEMKLRQLHMDQQSGYAAQQTSSRSIKPDSSPRNYGNANSSANRGDLSVKEIKRLRNLQNQSAQENQDAQVNSWVAKADKALASGKDGAARSYLRTAIRYASGNRKGELERRLQKLIDEN